MLVSVKAYIASDTPAWPVHITQIESSSAWPNCVGCRGKVALLALRTLAMRSMAGA